MSRPIDAEELLKAMDSHDKFGYSTQYGLERLDKDDKGFVPYVHYKDMTETVENMPTIHAIPIDRIEQARKEIEFADDTTYRNYKKIVLSILDKLIAESEVV